MKLKGPNADGGCIFTLITIFVSFIIGSKIIQVIPILGVLIFSIAPGYFIFKWIYRISIGGEYKNDITWYRDSTLEDMPDGWGPSRFPIIGPVWYKYSIWDVLFQIFKILVVACILVLIIYRKLNTT